MDASTPPPEPEPEPVPDPVDVPAGDYCAPVATWDPLWVQWEEEVLLLVNERRAQGASCGTQGTFPPAAPLTMNANLRCAARLHSMDMAVRNFFEHSNPDGLGPGPRIQAAGYSGGTMGENIAAGQSSPEAVVDAWMGSDGHCSNIMQSIFTDIGVGYYYESARPSHYWTEEFGGPGWRG